MSITRRCPWCGEDHPLKPSEARPGRLIAICSLLGRAYYDCAATFDVLLDATTPTEIDYEAALAEFETLMDAEPDTPECDRLEILSIIVEAYEDKHYPISPPDPVEAAKYRMESRGLGSDLSGEEE